MESDNVYIWFMIGECPCVPKSPDHCDLSSALALRLAAAWRRPPSHVSKMYYSYEIAKTYFGSRVRFWHELNEFGTEKQQYGYYGWNEIHDADEKLRTLGTEAH